MIQRPTRSTRTETLVPYTTLFRSQQEKRRGGQGGCNANLQYGMAWANRMPAEFPVYPKAKLREAAGADGGGCDLRVVSFVTNQPMQNVIDYYYTKAIRSGLDAEQQLMNGEHVLGGVRKKGDGAYFITFAQQKGGGPAVAIDHKHCRGYTEAETFRHDRAQPR